MRLALTLEGEETFETDTNSPAMRKNKCVTVVSLITSLRFFPSPLLSFALLSFALLSSPLLSSPLLFPLIPL
jgi:hypothetical protein